MHQLAAANRQDKKYRGKSISLFLLDDDSFRKLLVDVISAVLYRDNAAVLEVRYDGNRLTAIASEGEQEGVKLFIIRFYAVDDVFLFRFCISEVHFLLPIF